MRNENEQALLRNNSILDRTIWAVTSIQFLLLYIITTEENRSPVFFVCTLIILILYLLKTGMKIYFHVGAFHLSCFMISAYCFISAFWAIDSSESIAKGITIIETTICLSFVYAYYSRFNNVDKILKGIALAGAVIAVYTIVFFGVDSLVQTAEAGNRLDPDFANMNSIGMVCAQAIVIALFYFLKSKQLIYVLEMSICIVVCALSGSRKALVMMVLGSILILYYKSQSKNIVKRIVKIVGITLTLSIVFYFLLRTTLFSGVMERMNGMINTFLGTGSTESSAVVRTLMIKRALEVFFQNPIVGIGIGNSHLVNFRDTYFHNNYVELLACGGIFGVIIYYAVYIYIIVNLIRYRKVENDQTKLIATLVVLSLMMDYGAVSYYDKVTYFFLMVFCLHIQNLKKTVRNFQES